MKAELHSHSFYSYGTKISVEGLNSPAELVKQAKILGLGAIAITDHNEFRGGIEAEKIGKKIGVTVIKGEEIQTDMDRHVLGLGLSERIKPGHSAEETINLIRAQGGIAIAPHPFDLANKGLRQKARKCDAIEVFNSINLDRLSNKNAKIFAKKYSLNTVAGSDAHCIEMVGYGVTEISAENDVDSILKAIKKGRTSIHGKYIPIKVIQDWSMRRFNDSYWQVMQYIQENYSTPKRWVAGRLLKLTTKSPGKIDYLFKGLAYCSLGAAVCYSAAKSTKHFVQIKAARK
ncbi:MAG: PHP domain-containing protein [Candidatus Diapherotrites archaeon]